MPERGLKGITTDSQGNAWFYHSTNKRHGDLNDLKSKKIVTYCSDGYRGNIAAEELTMQGFDAVTIEGGYSAWKDGEKKNEDSSNSND